MGIDLPVTLRLLSHELRTPVGVIQGYLKMLGDGRIEEQMRPKVIAQIQRAVARVAVIGQQASDLSQWVADSTGRTCHEVSVRQLLDQIAAKAAGAVRLLPATAPEVASATILTPDVGALVDAGTSLVEGISRIHGVDAAVWAEPAEGRPGVDVSVAAAAAGGIHFLRAERREINVGEKGLGFSLLIAAAVACAHGGRLWEQPGQPVLGMTLPWTQK